MLRNQLIKKGIAHKQQFRLRGKDVSRVEAFSDSVFAFAITLTVVSLAIPQTFSDLQNALLHGSISFAICFALLIQVWYWHFSFFRRYGLENLFIVVLNAILLFVVLFYIYPLKFLFSLLVNQLLGVSTSTMIQPGQVSLLMIIYGIGYVAVNLIFAILYYAAYRKQVELDLSALEVHLTETSILTFLVFVAIGLSSVFLAALGREDYVSWSGYIYLLIAPAILVLRSFRGRSGRGLLKGLAENEKPSMSASHSQSETVLEKE